MSYKGHFAQHSQLNRVLSLLVSAALLLFGLATLRAQTGGQGAIAGTITDSTGAVIPNATVIATNTATNVKIFIWGSLYF